MLLMIKRFSLNLESDAWKWESVNKDVGFPIQPANIRDLTRDYDLCVTGEVNKRINLS